MRPRKALISALCMSEPWRPSIALVRAGADYAVTLRPTSRRLRGVHAAVALTGREGPYGPGRVPLASTSACWGVPLMPRVPLANPAG